ncbi:MAG TPA: cobalamin biosynthesis protein CobQ, partial [Roseovarius nubinhibens]|nr:cobalamin biosynthesis protein CobQ [Roseovarius nubinhibens]
MNTPAHVIFALAAFARPQERRRNLAAALGGLAPDLSLYLMTGAALAMGFSPREV